MGGRGTRGRSGGEWVERHSKSHRTAGRGDDGGGGGREEQVRSDNKTLVAVSSTRSV